MKNLFILLVMTLSLQVMAQNVTTVQTFTYESTTRDTVISFPTGDHNDYSKILMHYSMRCKDALVSTTAERNKGCGEWDYSCNTYVVDSTQIDSLAAVAPSHIISGFSGTTFDYTTQPTYTYFRTTQREVNYDNVISESEYAVGAGTEDESTLFTNRNIARSQMIYTASDMTAAGITAGKITGLKIDMGTANTSYTGMKIKLSNTALMDLSDGQLVSSGLQQVYFHNTEVTGGEQFFKFYNDFSWDGTSNVLVEFIYTNDTPSDQSVTASDNGQTMSLHADGSGDYNLEINGVGYVEIAQPMPTVTNEITVVFWSYGFDNLPVNTYAFEAVNAANQRTVNVHLPWSNGQVYWDCGNDGGSYDRINKVADASDYSKGWNHWAFTKNANTGIMNIYLNGTLWHTGSGFTRSMDIQRLNIGTNQSGVGVYYGKLDEFQLWNKALDASTISDWMRRGIDNTHPDYDKLVAYYKFDNEGNIVTDHSGNGFEGTIQSVPIYRPWKQNELIKNVQSSSLVANASFVQGEYEKDITVTNIIDSLQNGPNAVSSYIVENNDLILSSSDLFYESGDMPILDEFNNTVGTVNVPSEGSITISELDYYSKQPMRIELMSFVTPYGIGIDFGEEGKTWTFDVTDYGPNLKGDTRFLMNRGGQWQEEMDIRFEFIEGTPPRDIISTQQLWRVTSESNARIRSDERFEPRTLTIAEGADYVKVKGVITGHGQQGEFTSRNHHFNINQGPIEFQWPVWTECSDIPVFPQGGTWVYDRAGWCPGTPSDAQIMNISALVNAGEEVEVDYGMDEAGGTSNYIVNMQMVTYGEPNFMHEAEIIDINSPTDRVLHSRFNANCTAPKITIRNNGAELLKTLDIDYNVDGAFPEKFAWVGNVPLGGTTVIDLPFMNTNAFDGSYNTFNVSLSNPNGMADENEDNNSMSTTFDGVDHLSTDVVIRFRTNNTAAETRYIVTDVEGNLILNANSFSASNTTYEDTLKGLHGCYRLHITDLGGEGLSWWANPNDGSGFVQIGSVGQSLKTINPDFGSLSVYEFVAGDVTNVEDVVLSDQISIYPNPFMDKVNVAFSDVKGAVSIKLTNQMGQQLKTFNINDASATPLYPIVIEDYLSGIYYLEIQSEQGKTVRKIVKM